MADVVFVQIMVRSKQTLRKSGMNYNATGAHRQGT